MQMETKTASVDAIQSENEITNPSEAVAESTSELVPDTEVEAPIVALTDEVTEIEDLVGEEIEEPKTTLETEPEVEAIVETPAEDDSHIITLTPEELSNDALVYEHGTNDIINAIAKVNAAESEDETVRHEIPLQDYEALPMEALVYELETLVANEK